MATANHQSREILQARDPSRKTPLHLHVTSHLAMVAAMLALAVVGCTEGAADYVLTKREKTSTTWLDQQRDQLVCRVNQRDLGYTDTLAMKIPVHDERKEQLDCHQLVEAQRSAFRSAKSTPIFDPGFVLLGGAAQWMLAHPDVHQCVQKLDAPNFLLSEWLGRASGTQDSTNVLIRDCGDSHLFFLTDAVLSAGTAACGQADIPPCATAAR